MTMLNRVVAQWARYLFWLLLEAMEVHRLARNLVRRRTVSHFLHLYASGWINKAKKYAEG
jgi:hypothetical protein